MKSTNVLSNVLNRVQADCLSPSPVSCGTVQLLDRGPDKASGFGSSLGNISSMCRSMGSIFAATLPVNDV